MLLLLRKLALKSQCQELIKPVSQSPPPMLLCLFLVPEVGSQPKASSHGGRHIPDGKIIFVSRQCNKGFGSW